MDNFFGTLVYLPFAGFDIPVIVSPYVKGIRVIPQSNLDITSKGVDMLPSYFKSNIPYPNPKFGKDCITVRQIQEFIRQVQNCYGCRRDQNKVYLDWLRQFEPGGRYYEESIDCSDVSTADYRGGIPANSSNQDC